MNNYKYLIFDAQYFLTRNFKQYCNYRKDGDDYLVGGHPFLKEDGTPYRYIKPNFDYLTLAKVFFWSMAKFCRECASAQKVILAWDKYPYHRYSFLPDYKGDRHYASEEDLEGKDAEKDVQEIIDTQFEIDCLKIKQEAKWFIIRNFDRLGMKSYVKTGYEADDWANIIATHLHKTEPGVKSAIVSIDSDWSYLINPSIDYLKPNGTLTTYEDKMAELKDLDGLGLSLYRYKSIIDSLYGSHNSLSQTIKTGAYQIPQVEVIRSVMSSDELLANPELFNAQLASFEIEKFPEYENTQKSMYYLDKSGHIMDLIEYSLFTGETNFEVKEDYYLSYTSGLNPSLYRD